MPTNKHRVKAFTIMEVTISMLIAAIVIGITYTSYNIIGKSYLSFKTRNDDIAVLNRVDELLKRDFEQANMIADSGNGLLINKDNMTDVHYEFNRGTIIRKSGVIDTFKVSMTDLKTAFEGNLNNNQTEANTTSESARIDELSFTINFKDLNIPCHYQKMYSSLNLIQRNPDAVN
ncbi:hypothetical protein KXQ82_10420 [Mucilaginibacter sp. HMF5004]|uniref:PulJ/GspJ family protein n=1 Tax=Mucilaginibacter rivuli TaxID=2857527 RepID=UPI001C5D0EC1|nr:hypothetical protein [Mucilaginibacter rivuli]MBW4890133.1 hypothetical protein [Mucilaginibacter rivuli]